MSDSIAKKTATGLTLEEMDQLSIQAILAHDQREKMEQAGQALQPLLDALPWDTEIEEAAEFAKLEQQDQASTKTIIDGMHREKSAADTQLSLPASNALPSKSSDFPLMNSHKIAAQEPVYANSTYWYLIPAIVVGCVFAMTRAKSIARMGSHFASCIKSGYTFFATEPTPTRRHEEPQHNHSDILTLNF
ncbi:MAG: hypothetical protein V4501_02815 [Pseudomonadota bacterium]